MRGKRERRFWSVRHATVGVVVACAALVSVAPAAGMPANNFPYPYPETLTGDTKARDPMMIISATAPRYFLVSTGPGIPFRTSTDRKNWTNRVEAFPQGTDPAWWSQYLNPTNGVRDIWAPDISYRNGKYWMYYSVSWCVFNTCSSRAAIGLATSLTGLPGTWQDQGKVIDSQLNGPQATPWKKAIDPNLVVTPSGQWYLIFGSSGIWALALNPATGLSTTSPPAPVQLTTGHEGAYMYRRGSYYYLFHTRGTNTPGPTTSYSTHVGRSTSPTGPFVDRAGVRLIDDGDTRVLEGHGWMQATGHGGVFLETNDNKERLYAHYYDSRDNNQTYLGINTLNWTSDGWPYLIHNYGPQFPALSHPTPPDTAAAPDYPYQLFEDDYLLSENGAYRLKVQLDCNVVERRTSDESVVWATNTSNLGNNCRLVMQGDGNLRLINDVGTVLCESHTAGTGSKNNLSMQNDGNVVVYKFEGPPVWRKSDGC